MESPEYSIYGGNIIIITHHINRVEYTRNMLNISQLFICYGTDKSIVYILISYSIWLMIGLSHTLCGRLVQYDHRHRTAIPYGKFSL